MSIGIQSIMLNTFLSLKRLHGIDIKMINMHIPVQRTQQENHSNDKHYHKKTIKTPSSPNYC